MTKLLTFFGAALALIAAGCSSAPPPEAEGQASAAITSGCGAVLASIDGVVARSNGWAQAGLSSCLRNAGGVELDTGYGYGYQCVELAQRYLATRFSGFPTHWPVAVASQMCGATSGLPVSVHYKGSGYRPVHGDLMVFAGSAGHVAVVDSVDGSSLGVVEQNSSASGRSSRAIGQESCFIHANENAAGAAVSSDPCAGTTFDSWYCGGHKVPGDSRLAVSCVSGRQVDGLFCPQGCATTSDAAPDFCVGDEDVRCSCDGTDQDGNAVHSDACGSRVCGQDHVLWTCGAGGDGGYYQSGGGC